MNFDRSIAPQPANDLKFSLPRINKHILSNGLNVIFVKREFLPIVKLSLISNCGSFFDPLGNKGLANLFSMVIDEGAAEYNSLELSEEFEILGSTFNTSCSHDNLFLSLGTLSENFERSLELLSKIVLSPHLNQKDFEREWRKVEVRLLQQSDEPETLATLAFSNVVHGSKSPYSFSTLGYEDTIKNLNTNHIRKFYNDNFNPVTSYLIVVGSFSEEKLLGSLEKHLGSWNKKAIYDSIPVENSEEESNVAILDKAGSVQTEIRVGHAASKRNTSDYFAKTLMNIILGGQFTSRINLNLRENKGYTYGATSNFSYYKHAGEFCVSTSVSTENTLPAVTEIMNELTKIKDGITSAELEFAKSSITRRFPSQFESAGQIAANLSTLVIHDLPDNFFDTYLENVKNTTIDEVNEAAIKNINLNGLSFVLVGDKEKLVSQFKSAGLGKVAVINLKGEIVENI